MTATVVVAMAENGVIGRENGLPWHLPEDLRHFKELTLGRTLLMGRRTFDSIGRPLPGRRTVVLTRQRNWHHEGVSVIHSLDEARALIQLEDVVIAGGGELYAALLDHAEQIELTRVWGPAEGDTVFPEIDPARWEETSRVDRDGFSFFSYRRRNPEAEGRSG
jgi:dihydrofolate reductase